MAKDKESKPVKEWIKVTKKSHAMMANRVDELILENTQLKKERIQLWGIIGKIGEKDMIWPTTNPYTGKTDDEIDDSDTYVVSNSNGIILKANKDSNIVPKSYITVYKPIAGWKAVMMTPDKDGFVSPWTTSNMAFRTKEEAIEYAKDWARSEQMDYSEGGM